MKPSAIPSCVAIQAYDPAARDVLAAMGIPALRAWGRPANFWPQRSVLRVKFMNGTSKQQAEARKRFEAVDALVNLAFKFVMSGESEIRVAFDKGKGHWSYLGKGCLQIPQSKPPKNHPGATSRDAGSAEVQETPQGDERPSSPAMRAKKRYEYIQNSTARIVGCSDWFCHCRVPLRLVPMA